MDISLLTLNFPPEIGGVQTYLYETMQRIALQNNVTIITPAKGSLPKTSSFTKVEISKGKAHLFWQSLRHHKPHKILLGHAHPQLLLPAMLYSKNNYATIVHGNDYLAAQHRWHRPIFNWLLAHSQHVIVNSQANATRLTQLGIHNPIVIYPGADIQRYHPADRENKRPFTLLTLGRLVPRKGIDIVLRTLPRLLAVCPNLRYLVAGNGPDQTRLEQLAMNLNVAHAVEFLGRIPEDKLPKLYQTADVFVMPAREIAEAGSVEGFGIVYLEASASGLPVVAGHSGGAVEAVRPSKTGLLVDPTDEAELANVLLRLLQDEPWRHQLGQNGRHWVETEMNWDRAAQQLAETLQL